MNSNTMPPIGRPSIGDTVTVFERAGRFTRTYSATIAKVGRAWVTLVGDLPPDASPYVRQQEWRMRIATQSDGSRHFRTGDQLIWEDELKAANAILKDNGIAITMNGPWDTPMSRVKLAKFITANQ